MVLLARIEDQARSIRGTTPKQEALRGNLTYNANVTRRFLIFIVNSCIRDVANSITLAIDANSQKQILTLSVKLLRTRIEYN